MKKWNAYWRLCRFDKPAGILLLWYPTVWALWVANKGMPSLKLFCLFLLGTIFMRAAGCVINDMADRHIDKHVTRTRTRPLTSGEVSFPEALYLLLILLGGALIVAMNLPYDCFYIAIIALLLTIVYPFCKRFLEAPQLVLGLAFSMGIPIAFKASEVAINNDAILLLIINFCWIVSYDTMYAMTDKVDDLKIGVKSTAIYFSSYDRTIIGLLQLLLHSLWLYWALVNQVNALFYIFWFMAGLVLIFQQKLISKRIPEECFKAFLVSTKYGLLMFLSLVFG